ncbi:MAG: glutamine--fructose-6-phosphate transaminase (isomerizing) [Bacilli bacterium]
MCGIVGYIGNDNATEIVINGLKKLEYRGYDSAGIAYFKNGDVNIIKSVGKILNLEKKINDQKSNLVIGHTRWATHGVPNECNSHPHHGQNKQIVLVHNGVIENYNEIKDKYLQDCKFYSQTDTEVLSNLMEKFIESGLSMEDSLEKLIDVVDGSYALAVVNKDYDNKLYVAKNKSPILVGIGDGFNMLGSDALAMYAKTSNVLEINDKEYGVITKDDVVLYDKNGTEVKREKFSISIDASESEKGIYDHYMLKEIHDQSSVIRGLIAKYLPNGKVNIDQEIIEMVKNAKAIRIIAAGTSYYSGLVNQSLLEKFIKKSVLVHIASEFTYDMPLLDKDDLCIFISQSGETADLRAALVKVKEQGLKTVTITNVEGSTLSRETEKTLFLYAGREIAVASTKAFIAQVTTLAILGYSLSNREFDLYSQLSKVASVIESVLENKEQVSQIVKKSLLTCEHCFVLGRGVDYKTSLEGALKLKEISYIHTEGMSSGELKHGTIALIEEGTPTIFLITQGDLALNTRSNIMEVESRGANVITIVNGKYAKDGDDLVFPEVCDELAPLVSVVYMQLISYYTSLYLEKDIDMPRNLAKSVTVE